MISMRFLLNSRSLLMCRSINCLHFHQSIDKQIINKSIIRSLNNCVIIQNTNQDQDIVKKSDDYHLNHIISDDLIDFKPIDGLSNQINNEYLDEMSPSLDKSFNLSAFANRSQTLQLLIKLGVDLSQIESKSLKHAEFLLRLNFDEDIKPYITFLTDNGLNSSDLGYFITKNPLIFKQHLDDLEVRINYLRAKRFTKEMIASVITKAPKFLSYDTKFIDSHLGFIQKEYQLTGHEMRHIVTSYPRIALLHSMSFRESSFMFKEEFGFQMEEIKEMLLKSPVIWKKAAHWKGHSLFAQNFDFVHNEMKIPHELICKSPLIFTRRLVLLKPRHFYLKKLGRDQYDPKLPLYVPLNAFYTIEDNEFCDKYARTTVYDFNLFCKTL